MVSGLSAHEACSVISVSKPSGRLNSCVFWMKEFQCRPFLCLQEQYLFETIKHIHIFRLLHTLLVNLYKEVGLSHSNQANTLLSCHNT